MVFIGWKIETWRWLDCKSWQTLTYFHFLIPIFRWTLKNINKSLFRDGEMEVKCILWECYYVYTKYFVELLLWHFLTQLLWGFIFSCPLKPRNNFQKWITNSLVWKILLVLLTTLDSVFKQQGWHAFCKKLFLLLVLFTIIVPNEP